MFGSFNCTSDLALSATWRNEWYYENNQISWRIWFIDKRSWQNNESRYEFIWVTKGTIGYKGKYILILGEERAKGLDDLTVATEATYPTHFTQAKSVL